MDLKQTLLITFLVFISSSGLSSGRLHRRQSNRLDILPRGPFSFPIGRNLFFTCKANVPNPGLVQNLKWYTPNGQEVPEDDRVYTEEQPGDAATMLFIKNLRQTDTGQYTCRGIYANTEEMSAQVEIKTFIGITWEDAPTDQYATIHTDSKIRCVVKAQPAATIDWLKESLIISTGQRYVVESDGLLIRNVTPEDAGTYTCRARVMETGSLEEKDIKLEVQVPPKWIKRPVPVKGIELERVDMECEASGIPNPRYTWVDWEKRDATDKDGWKIEEDTGHLIGYRLKREDEGRYTCIAENDAGRIEASTDLDVIIRPKVQELYNKTFVDGEPNGKIVCKASGDPLPEIIWRRWSRNEPYILGGQPNDDRIYVENRVERAPDYTEGEREWMVSELIINNVRRSDDDLYECQARNEGGKYFKTGHIQVEFAPTFEEQPMVKQWSWDQNPVNLTCIATGIPNATVTWWVREREVNREFIDRNLKIIGHGPRSDLIVTPLDLQYYGMYTCKAVNPHGEAFHEIELREAHEPGYVLQAVTDKVTATTIQFRFVAPTDTGGLPIESYAVEYKEAQMSWPDARRRVWPLQQSGVYILEALQPMTTYDFRFGAKNLVGFSEWGAAQQFTMPRRGPPEAPAISSLGGPNSDSVFLLDTDYLNLTSPTEYELSWFLPEDNGEPVDFFEVSYYAVRFQGSTQSWVRQGDLFRTEVPHPGNVRYAIDKLYPNTFYMVEIRAHNSLGYSQPSSVVVKTARGSGNDIYPSLPPSFSETRIPVGLIIGVIVAILVLGFVLVDLACFKINRQGITWMVCQRTRRRKKCHGANGRKGGPHPPPMKKASQQSNNGTSNGMVYDGSNIPLIDDHVKHRPMLSSQPPFSNKGVVKEVQHHVAPTDNNFHHQQSDVKSGRIYGHSEVGGGGRELNGLEATATATASDCIDQPKDVDQNHQVRIFQKSPAAVAARGTDSSNHRPGASDFSPHPRGSTKAKIRSKGINNKGGTTNSQNGISGKKGRNINNSNKNRTASPPAEDDEEGHCHKSAILKNHRRVRSGSDSGLLESLSSHHHLYDLPPMTSLDHSHSEAEIMNCTRGQHFYDSTSELTLQGAGESIYSIPNEDFGEGRKFSVHSTSANDETLRTRHKSVTDELKSTLVPSSDPDTAEDQTSLKRSPSKNSLTISLKLSSATQGGQPTNRASKGSGLNMDHFTPKKDFGDFQILTDSPAKRRPTTDKQPFCVDV